MGWGIWIAYATNPPSEAAALLQYSSAHVSGLYNSGQKELTGLGIVVAVALILVLVLVAVNWFGVLLFAAAGFHGSNYSSHGGFAPYGYAAPLSAIASAGIIYAYTGFQGPLDLSGEARNPQRDVLRAVISAGAVDRALCGARGRLPRHGARRQRRLGRDQPLAPVRADRGDA